MVWLPFRQNNLIILFQNKEVFTHERQLSRNCTPLGRI